MIWFSPFFFKFSNIGVAAAAGEDCIFIGLDSNTLIAFDEMNTRF